MLLVVAGGCEGGGVRVACVALSVFASFLPSVSKHFSHIVDFHRYIINRLYIYFDLD
jgi:hypothetical protein